ncbi:MAG: hypothetical protein CM1200mP2_12750 [Planctomycetaceae bacterium]|nr:MAG: hypothetical protein CM1200mP2_12750 [Planctomycetaceae bacterium]
MPGTEPASGQEVDRGGSATGDCLQRAEVRPVLGHPQVHYPLLEKSLLPFANRAFAALLGTSMNEACWTKRSWSRWVNSDGHPSWARSLPVPEPNPTVGPLAPLLLGLPGWTRA